MTVTNEKLSQLIHFVCSHLRAKRLQLGLVPDCTRSCTKSDSLLHWAPWGLKQTITQLLKEKNYSCSSSANEELSDRAKKRDQPSASINWHKRIQVSTNTPSYSSWRKHWSWIYNARDKYNTSEQDLTICNQYKGWNVFKNTVLHMSCSIKSTA